MLKLSQKMEPPKTVEDKLAEKKRKLDKKKAYCVDSARAVQQDALKKHEQVDVLEEEYEILRTEFQSGPSQQVLVELDSADQPLPYPDGDELTEPQDDAKRSGMAGDGHMNVDGQVTTPAVVESSTQAAEAIDVVEFRKL